MVARTRAKMSSAEVSLRDRSPGTSHVGLDAVSLDRLSGDQDGPHVTGAGSPTRRPEATQKPLFVVVGVDGSRSSEAALSWGIRAAQRRRLPLRVVYVESVDLPNSSGKDLVGAHLRRAAGAHVRAQGVVQSGDPVQVLPEQAHDAALVVVGAIGQAGPRHLRLGSVADHLIQQARCPVIVTPDPANTTAGGRSHPAPDAVTQLA